MRPGGVQGGGKIHIAVIDFELGVDSPELAECPFGCLGLLPLIAAAEKYTAAGETVLVDAAFSVHPVGADAAGHRLEGVRLKVMLKIEKLGLSNEKPVIEAVKITAFSAGPATSVG